MFNKLILTLVLLTTTLFGQVDFKKAMLYKADIDSKTAYEMQQKGSLIIDVRTKKEFETLAPKDAINIPIFMEKDGKRIFNQNFSKEVSTALNNDFDKKVILICRSGGRSKFASNFLASQGFKNIYNIKSGFVFDWAKTDLPTNK